MLNQLREIQKRCDELSFSIDNNKYPDIEKMQILKHKCFHLAKLLSKIASVCEQDDHNIDEPVSKIVDEVIPDLLVYSLQLANLYNIDLEEKYKERLNFIIDKGHLYFKNNEKDALEFIEVIKTLFDKS
jgi:hypothetical protein